jgi:nucleoside-diphosphate-sugar epimerase
VKVVVFGATGNVGSALMRALSSRPDVTSLVGVARRVPAPPLTSDPRLSWHACDIASDSLAVIDGADVVVQLAWQIQPSRDEAAMRRTNVIGTTRIARAVADREVPALVCASSVGTYAAHSRDERVDETWSATGIESSTYSRHKAEVELMLDTFEAEHPRTRVVRMRTSLVFQRSAASRIHRLFLGPFLPWHLPRSLRIVPGVSSLQFQATHADDVADAYLRVITSEVAGPFNVAAEPVLDPAVIADAVGGRTVPMSRALLRTITSMSYAVHLQPTEPGWIDMATRSPLMDASRVRDEVGWLPRHSSVSALRELLDGIGDGAGGTTPPLHPRRPPTPSTPSTLHRHSVEGE